MTRPIGTVAMRQDSNNKKAMFCSSEKCCEVVGIAKTGYKRKAYLSRILVTKDFSIKKCPDCNGDLFISNFNTKTPTKKDIL